MNLYPNEDELEQEVLSRDEANQFKTQVEILMYVMRTYRHRDFETKQMLHNYLVVESLQALNVDFEEEEGE